MAAAAGEPHPGASDLASNRERTTADSSEIEPQPLGPSPDLLAYTDVPIRKLLDKVIAYIECQIAFADDVMSPQEKPCGIVEQHNDQIAVCLGRFRSAGTLSVSIRDYMERLHQHCEFSSSKLLALVYYLTTLEGLYARISKVLRQNTVHRLVLAGFVIASKVLDDRISRQIRYSVVGGLSLAHLHGLELALFFLLNGQVWLTEARLIDAGKVLYGHPPECPVEPLLKTTDDVIWSQVGNRAFES
ncbi:cyclin-domain-containing protein [Protomyces lactucae-debilis]|uniref:Cyclin-domain-containing protein n=1 Tax=Protomyces lactucae-debilis TaxID=2754530 RepID=A0A1Y2FIZ7_PROLT|nr:cyclin-domain-containing protein [Protomyces lactucae-debilis]ORY83918.1 cyclin-domain-containing protein [Protomyces lactucae-debilis]